MGKQGKASDLGKKGRIGIAVDKPAYIAGEVVRGTIYVDIYEPINGVHGRGNFTNPNAAHMDWIALVLKATGKEKVAWRETYTEVVDGNTVDKHEHHEAEKEFFKQKIVISAMSAMYLPGQYLYPFAYELPVELPGSFHLASHASGHVDKLEAKIKYKLKAMLDVDGFFASDLKADCSLAVHERNFQSIQPSEDSTTQSVNFLCCINRGSCSLAVAMDKNVYLPGETAHIQCHINNGSQVDIMAMRCRLYQDVRVVSGHGHEHKFTREVATRAFPGVPAGSTLQQPQPLLLAASGGEVANPSTTSTFVRCSYRIVVECDIPWCPDVELHLPVTIIAPEIPNLSWVPASTDGYVQQHRV